MRSLAESLGYQTTLVTDSEATSLRVLEEISAAARELRSGDIFLLTYSGHGGQVQDVNDEEPDRNDETWVLWDRQVIDDELYALWAQFEAGVRIVVFSDSCHSGTVAKVKAAREIQQLKARAKGASEPKSKNMPLEVQNKVNERHRGIYNTVQWLSGAKADRDNVQASVILISGCQDNQLSYDGDYYGRFTSTVLEVWANGEFQGDYEGFHREILNRMPPEQSPNYFTTGALYQEFEDQRPFTIEPPGVAGDPTPQPEPEPTTSRPTLRKGDKGQDVIYLQKLLRQNGYSVVPDGIFGSHTESQVRAFQSSEGLTADGMVGPQTWAALEAATPVGTGTQPSQPMGPSQPTQPQGGGPSQPTGTRPTLRPGATGDDVRYLQKKLIEAAGYSVIEDGVYGPRTVSAVRSFQSAQGLTSDGVVGPQAWEALEQVSVFT